MKKILYGVIFIGLLTPSFVFALWWNPSTWFIKKPSFPLPQIQTETPQPITSSSTETGNGTTTSIQADIEETIKPTGFNVRKATTTFVTNTKPSPTPEPTCTLKASPNQISIGQPFYLSWVSTNATSSDLQPDYGAVSVNGSKRVVIASTGIPHDMNFTLTVSGRGGKSSCSVYVPVTTGGIPIATIDKNSLNTTGGIVNLTGTAVNTTGIMIGLASSTYSGSKLWDTMNTNSSYSAITNVPITIINGKWSITFKDILPGKYSILVYDKSVTHPLLVAGDLYVTLLPGIAITSTAIVRPSSTNINIRHEYAPAGSQVRIINSSGATVWKQDILNGGTGLKTLTLPTILPTGVYLAQLYDANGKSLASSRKYYFTPSGSVLFTATLISTSTIAYEISGTEKYIIKFGDGKETIVDATKSKQTVNHTYKTVGTYTAELIVQTGTIEECLSTCSVGTATVTVTGKEERKLTMLALPSTGYAPLVVTFALDKDFSGSTIIFGDGQTIVIPYLDNKCLADAACGDSPVTLAHTYKNVGAYGVKITNRFGESAGKTYSGTITVTKKTATSTNATSTGL